MKRTSFIFASILFTTLFAVVALQSGLATAADDGLGIGENFTIQRVFGIIVGLACYLIRISIILILIAVLYYGFRFLLSRGDPTKVAGAKTALGWGIVGILVIFSTYTIIQTVNYAVTDGEGDDIELLDCSGV